MQVFFEIISVLLGAYLAFTQSVATQLETILGTQSPSPTSQQLAVQADAPKQATAPSEYEKGGAIPRILIENAAYQKAAVVESIDPKTATATAVEALVNIYCTYRTNDTIRTTTGTGFFVDTQGVILTNAHVAQFLLFEGVIGETECVIRTGNPAEPRYRAELLYISPTWVREHADIINQEQPKGTGERDYALLYIASTLDSTPLPGHFPALPFDVELLRTDRENTEVYAAGYPADTLLRNGIDSPLIPKLATTTIAQLMTFGSNYADIFSITGSIIGERGSSGGPVVDKDGYTIGLISTRGDDARFGSGTLRAITISYIDRTIREETGYGLLENLQGNLPYRADLFKQTIVPFLQNVLERELEG